MKKSPNLHLSRHDNRVLRGTRPILLPENDLGRPGMRFSQFRQQKY